MGFPDRLHKVLGHPFGLTIIYRFARWVSTLPPNTNMAPVREHLEDQFPRGTGELSGANVGERVSHWPRACCSKLAQPSLLVSPIGFTKSLGTLWVKHGETICWSTFTNPGQ